MKKILVIILFMAISMLSFTKLLSVQGQVYMDLTVDDDGNPPPSTSTDWYYIQIDVVEVNQFGVVQYHYSPNNQNQMISYNDYYNAGVWQVDVSCSDGPIPDVAAYIYRVDYIVWRDTYPPSDPPIASGPGSSPLQNSESFYAGFNAQVSIK